MKKLLSINAILAFIWLNMFIWGIGEIFSAGKINSHDAMQSIQVESASMEEINAAMINLAQQHMCIGSVIAIIGGGGLIVCMNWFFIFLKKESEKIEHNTYKK